MTLDHRSERVGPLLHATVHGGFTLAEAKRLFRALLEECATAGLPLLLLDCRSVRGDPTMMERFDFAEYVAGEYVAAVDAGRAPRIRIALVGRPPLIEPGRFGETVAVNRGAWIKVTTEIEDAALWLGLDPSTLLGPDPAR